MIRYPTDHAIATFIPSSTLDRLDPRLSVPQAPPVVYRAQQVHGVQVLEVPRTGSGDLAGLQLLGEADGVATDLTRVGVAVVTADCLPILLSRPGRVVAVHAGWRGLLAGVIEQGVAKLLDDAPVTGTHRAVRAWIGPAIGPCCFEVGHDVAAQLTRRFGSRISRPRRGTRRPHIDLAEAATASLRAVDIERLVRTPVCTQCDPQWASYRRDGPGQGRNLAVIWRPDATG